MLNTTSVISPSIEEKESGKTVINMSLRELESVMQQAVSSREIKEDDFVTLLDDSGKMYRRYDDGRVEYVSI